MSHDEFTKLFNYLEKFRFDVDKRFDKVEARISRVEGTVAELAGQIKDQRQEFIMLTSQTNRHERWHHEIAGKIGHKLT